MKVMVIRGKSGSGKTTLIEKLVPLLTARGIKTGVVKHTHHPFEIDYEGKDSRRFADAGADGVVISSELKTALVESHKSGPELDEILQRFFTDYDLVLVEGYRESAYPKIAVCLRPEDVPDLQRHNIIALATDEKIEVNLPVFGRSDADAIAKFIVENAVEPAVEND